ncbi:sulfate ABC transporter permease subunit CysT [Luteolibacter pohnpeiensis]|uniref:Sulfate transport system permease protein CysT n=1 Tax=Luteolibacter pohnpeiensis TaxID=454153 RepID=A0A934S663_9BACT|nr:sulfate ABC transporter permease subunit CysT [Luteolibacter pohnpeiensis]MBK1881491.1 sulfate ABC transporter permease subunit CysT [Luteolibacter pohnpeiensis]
MPKRRVIPGFGLTLGFTISYLSLIILIPLAALFIKAAGLSWSEWIEILGSRRVIAAAELTFGASFAAAIISTLFGLLVTWVLVRYRFPGRRLLDAMVDLPFALPTAVAGITLTTIYAPNGWIGEFLGHWGIRSSYSPLGVVIALTFIGFPFVVRTLQPVMDELGKEIEEAAATLGANRWIIFYRVILPLLLPALTTGFTLAFARAIGEYGSVIFISGNLPMKTEILPLLIVSQLEQLKYSAAAVIASSMLIISFLLLFLINLLQHQLNWQKH